MDNVCGRSSRSEASGGRRWLAVRGPAALWGIAALSLIAYASSAGTLVDHDCLVMGACARRVLAGEVLYDTVWDNKPPLALLFYVLPQALAPGSYLAQQVFGWAWTLGQSLLAWYLLGFESRLVRLVAACLVLLMPLFRVDFVWASSEDVVNLFSLVSCLIAYRIAVRGAWTRAELFVSGLVVALALHARQTGVLLGILPVVALLMTRRAGRAGGLVAYAIGGMCGLAVVLVLVVLTGDLAGYVQTVFVGPWQYSRGGPDSGSGGIKDHVFGLQHQAVLLLLVLAPFLVAGRRRQVVILTASIALAGLAVLAPMKPFGHYQQQLIPVVVIATAAVVRALETHSRSLAVRFAAALLLFFSANAAVTAGRLWQDDGSIAEMETALEVAESAASPDDTIFAVGRRSAYFYFRSRLQPVHTIHWDLFFTWLADVLPMDVGEVSEAIVQKPPHWLFIDAESARRYLAEPAPPAVEAMGHTDHLGPLLRRLTAGDRYTRIRTIGRWRVHALVQ